MTEAWRFLGSIDTNHMYECHMCGAVVNDVILHERLAHSAPTDASGTTNPESRKSPLPATCGHGVKLDEHCDACEQRVCACGSVRLVSGITEVLVHGTWHRRENPCYRWSPETGERPVSGVGPTAGVRLPDDLWQYAHATVYKCRHNDPINCTGCFIRDVLGVPGDGPPSDDATPDAEKGGDLDPASGSKDKAGLVVEGSLSGAPSAATASGSTPLPVSGDDVPHGGES